MSPFDQLTSRDYEWSPETARVTSSPALVIYKDLVRENISRVIEYLGGDVNRWRPHIKTLKIPAIYAELIDAGVRHFKCATLREAKLLLELLDRKGIEGADLLVAYPLVQPAIYSAGALARSHAATSLSILCEDPADVDTIAGEVGIFIDVNPGMNRTGIPFDRAEDVESIAAAAGDRFRGVHYYDGHLGGMTDPERSIAAAACYDRLMEQIWELRRAGHETREVVTSGTPTFRKAMGYGPFSNMNGPVHRVSPGTAVYHDLRSEQENDDVELLPAALVFSRIVSRPARDIATCDAGSKSISADAGDPCAFVIGHPQFEPLPPSEEHLPLRHPPSEQVERGDVLMLVPRHVCTTVNLAEKAIIVEGGEVTDIVDVAARAHEL